MSQIVPLFDGNAPPMSQPVYIQQARDDIRTLLRQGLVIFRFHRKTYDGSSRFARGTTDLLRFNIPIPTGPSPARNHPDLVVYWDFDRNGWRSFYMHNLTYYIAPPEGGEDFTPSYIDRTLSPSEKKGLVNELVDYLEGDEPE